jgi:hypothetical protein
MISKSLDLSPTKGLCTENTHIQLTCYSEEYYTNEISRNLSRATRLRIYLCENLNKLSKYVVSIFSETVPNFGHLTEGRGSGICAPTVLQTMLRPNVNTSTPPEEIIDTSKYWAVDYITSKHFYFEFQYTSLLPPILFFFIGRMYH